jgi:hypothetical protein
MPRAPAAWLVLLGSTSALNNGVGRTPAMGWNSWNTFRCDIDERVVLEVAAAMPANGPRDAGYVYVNVDDCWIKGRDEQGHIVPDAVNIPRGMKAVADEASRHAPAARRLPAACGPTAFPTAFPARRRCTGWA